MSVNERARHLPDPQRRKLLEHARAATGGLALAACGASQIALARLDQALFFQRSKGKTI